MSISNLTPARPHPRTCYSLLCALDSCVYAVERVHERAGGDRLEALLDVAQQVEDCPYPELRNKEQQ